MCALAELVRINICLKQIRPDYHYFAASLPFRSVRAPLTGFKVRGGEYRGCILQTRASQRTLPRKTFTFFQCPERAVVPRERQVGEGESRDGGIQRHVLKGLVSSGHKGSSPPRAAASAHLCHVVNLHHQSAPLLPLAGFPNHSQNSWSSSRRCSGESLTCNCEFFSLQVHISSKIL